MRKTALTTATLAIVPLIFAAPAIAAEAMEMQLHGGGHFQGAGQPLVEAFTARTGIPATYVPGNTGDGEFLEKIHAGTQIDVIVVNRTGQVLRTLAPMPRAAEDVGVQFDLPLSWLAPGEYAIRLTATTRSGNASELIRFRVTG